MEYPNKLRQVMQEKHVSQYELQKRTGLSLSTIRGLQRGQLDSRLYTWQRIAKALDVETGKLFD